MSTQNVGICALCHRELKIKYFDTIKLEHLSDLMKAENKNEDGEALVCHRCVEKYNLDKNEE